jgi:hypothetical protein
MQRVNIRTMSLYSERITVGTVHRNGVEPQAIPPRNKKPPVSGLLPKRLVIVTAGKRPIPIFFPLQDQFKKTTPH